MHRKRKETPAPPSGVLVADHGVQPYGYYGWRSAGTRDWLITYTLAGKGRFRLGDFVYTCGAHDLVMLAPGTPHDYATIQQDQHWNFYWCHFIPRPHWLPWLSQLPQVRPGLVIVSSGDSTIRSRLEGTFERLVRDIHLPGALQEDLALNALEEALLLVVQQHTAQGGRSLDSRVELVLQELSQKLDNPPSVTELAQLVALSPSHLAHLFKASVGDSIAATHLKLRLRHAARLLEFTEQSVSEIALRTGFRSAFYFSRCFREHYAMPPTTFRQQRQEIVADWDG